MDKIDNQPIKSDSESQTMKTEMPISHKKQLMTAFSKIGRELTEQDLNSPGTQRLLLNELDKYEECQINLELYRERYHQLNTQCAVYKEKIKSSTLFEIICSAMLAIGPALMTLAPNVLDSQGNWDYRSYIILSLGIITLAVGVISKCLQYKK